jgi:plasmid stabilization system protein ParE
MTFDLVVEPRAEAEISEARDWYDERNFGLGADFVLAVDAVLISIQQNPLKYQITFGRFRRAGLRRFPYGLIYTIANNEITVVACFHGRRNPNVLRERIRT